jgi:hypothetical protein
MRSRPDVRSGVSDSTSLVGEFSKKEEAGPYCLARIFVLSSRLEKKKKTIPMWCGVFNWSLVLPIKAPYFI